MNQPVRICVSLLIAGGLAAALPAQDTPIPSAPAVAERSPDDLDDLLGPIALYPDDLIAIILPAAARPTDIVLAARYLENNGATDKLDEQAWDESVRALAHFPDVVEWMNKNLAWTQEVGDAFALQSADVMKSIQRLRGKAYAAGTLRDTEQQKVLVDGNVIRIVSAEEDVIHVPSYRTEVVYVDHPVHYYEPWITFGIGWAVGSWHHWSCDWYGYNVWVFDHHDHWHDHNHHHYHGNPYYYGHYYQHGYHHNYGHAWSPPRSYAHYNYQYRGGDRNGYHNRTNYRPGPYVENESRRRNWNRGGNPNGDNSNRSDGVAADGRANERNEDTSNNFTRRGARGPRSDRGTPDANPNPGVVVNNGGTPTDGTSPTVTDSGGRNGRTRDNPFNRGNANDSRSGDSSRRPRTSTPANPTVPTVVATPDSAPPVVTSSRRSRQNRAPADNSGRPEYTRRSRQETRGESNVNRTVQAYAPTRTESTSNASSGGESRSNTSRSSVSSVRRYNDTSSGSVARTTTSSSSNHNHGGGDSGRSASSSSNSGRSHGSDSGRSNNSGGGNGGGRSTGNAGSGRGR